MMHEYTVPGPAGDYTVQLSDEEARERGLTPASRADSAKAKAVASNKQGPAPQNKGAAPAAPKV